LSKIPYLYKLARLKLGLTQKSIAKKAGISKSLVGHIESGVTNNPSWVYTRYLVENGINYFYLVGLSDEIEGQLVDMVTKSEYELLQTENEDLQNKLTELQSKYDLLQDALQIEVDENGKLKKRN